MHAPGHLREAFEAYVDAGMPDDYVIPADYFFDRRAKGTFHALAFGAVPVERTRVNRRSAEVATDLLADGWSLVIFPEGGRSPDGWAQEFRGGAAYLSVRSGRPVVPVYLDGTRHMWPKGQRLPRPHKVTVTFGTPLSPDPGEDARRLAARLERAVASQSQRRIQCALGSEALQGNDGEATPRASRRSVWGRRDSP